MKAVTLTDADKTAIAKEQIAQLKSEKAGLLAYLPHCTHKDDVNRQILRCDAEINRFVEWGGLK